MKIIEKITENNYFLFCAFLVLGIVVFYPTLNGYPVFDDFAFIFNSEQFKQAESPLVFFERRSWPVSFSFLWVIFKIAGENFVVFKAVNLLLHIINTFLVSVITKKLNISLFWLVGLIFLLHPMQIESISWIFQLKTVLSVMFALLSFLLLLKTWQETTYKKYLFYAFSLLFFTVSLYSKITAIFFPAFWLIFSLTFNRSNRLNAVLVLPYFLLSFWSGTHTLYGVTVNNYENLKSQQFEQGELISKQDVEDSQAIAEKPSTTEDKVKQKEPVTFDYIDQAKFKVSTPYELSNNLIAVYNLGFYFSHFFLGTYNSLVYLKERFSTIETHVYSYIFILFLLFFIIFVLRGIDDYKEFFIGFCLFFFSILPVLGFKYVPYMKYSYIADHWAYLSLFGLSIIIVGAIDVIKRVVLIDIAKHAFLVTLVCFTLFQLYRSVVYVRIFNHKYNVLWNAINHNPQEPSLYLTLANYYQEDDDNVTSREMYAKAYGQENLESDINVLRLVVQYFNQLGSQEKMFDSNIFYAIKSIQSQNVDEAKRVAEMFSGISIYQDVSDFLKTLVETTESRGSFKDSMEELFAPPKESIIIQEKIEIESQ